MRFAVLLTALLACTAATAEPRHLVGYYPSWLSAKAQSLAATSPRYSHVVLAFARPDFSWNGRDWRGTGLQFSTSPESVRKQIKVLQARGTKVVVAVGGATYIRWTALAAERDKPGAITAALTRFVADMGLDGIDVDYERDGVSPEIVAEYRAAIAVLRTVSAGKLLTLAAWSTGADCTTQTGLQPCDGKYSEAGGSSGRERVVFRDMTLLDKIDVVNVMSYDAGVAEFDPVMAWRLYREILPSKVVVNIGFEIAPEGWGGGTLVENAARCSSAKVVKDQFRQSVQKPYSIDRSLRDGPLTAWPHSNGQDGAMLWHIFKDQKSPACGGRRAASAKDVEEAARVLLGR